jgi:hypothetical protein
MTGRLQQGLSRLVTHLNDQFFPPVEEGLDSLDTLVIAADQGRTDAAGLDAIRSWLYRGGRLWVMLDRVDARWLETLLGDEFDCQVVDRVSLTSVEVSSASESIHLAPEHTEYERPVDLVRVIVDDAPVLLLANGWPAAFRKQCGAGELLVTALGSDAWAHPRTANDPSPAGGVRDHTNYVPSAALLELTPDVFSVRPPPPLPAAALESRLREYVGYAIPSRGTVVGLLVAFCAMLVMGSVWLAKMGRLEWLGVLAPVLALAAGGSLAGIGRTQRESVLPAAATLQFVRPIPGTDTVQTTGAAGLYATSTGTAELSGVQGGRLIPDMSGMEGKTRRLVWDDLSEWRWEFVPQSPGLRSAEVSHSGQSSSRIEARASFDKEGLSGRVFLPPGVQPEDAILATRNGRIEVDMGTDGAFRAAAASVLAPQQYLGSDLLGDEQHRRQEVLAELLGNPAATGFPSEPLLLFWTAPWDCGLQFDPQMRRIGSALVALPIEQVRPPAGTSVRIPSPLLPYREGIGPDGAAPVGLFDNRSLRWQPKSAPSSTWILIQIPHKLLPVAPTEARLVIGVSGPVGRLEIAGYREGRVVEFQSWVDPIGTLTATIRDLQALQPGADGRIAVRVSGGDPDRPELTNTSEDGTGHVSYWAIESLDVELRATVSGMTGGEVPP